VSFLLDTMTVLWVVKDPKRIPAGTRNIIQTTDQMVFVSAISAWEYRHKRLTKPNELPVPFEDLIAIMPVAVLDFQYDAAEYASSLPLIHRDPFDRMLIALALHHDLTLVTSDREIRRYAVKTLW
jgi:PIN domain nuclease of toxin-antitoxin system